VLREYKLAEHLDLETLYPYNTLFPTVLFYQRIEDEPACRQISRCKKVEAKLTSSAVLSGLGINNHFG